MINLTFNLGLVQSVNDGVFSLFNVYYGAWSRSAPILIGRRGHPPRLTCSRGTGSATDHQINVDWASHLFVTVEGYLTDGHISGFLKYQDQLIFFVSLKEGGYHLEVITGGINDSNIIFLVTFGYSADQIRGSYKG